MEVNFSWRITEEVQTDERKKMSRRILKVSGIINIVYSEILYISACGASIKFIGTKKLKKEKILYCFQIIKKILKMCLSNIKKILVLYFLKI